MAISAQNVSLREITSANRAVVEAVTVPAGQVHQGELVLELDLLASPSRDRPAAPDD